MAETDWSAVEITIVPDPCWTPEAEAAAQSWLALIHQLDEERPCRAG